MGLVEGFDIDQSYKALKYSKEAEENMISDAEDVFDDTDYITLNETAKNISTYEAVYICYM